MLSLSLVDAQQVSAYQAGAYQPGLLNTRDLGTIDTPGLLFLDYNYWNKSDSYYDQFGNQVTSIEIDRGLLNTTLDLSPQVSGYINVPVLFYTSNEAYLLPGLFQKRWYFLKELEKRKSIV